MVAHQERMFVLLWIHTFLAVCSSRPRKSRGTRFRSEFRVLPRVRRLRVPVRPDMVSAALKMCVLTSAKRKRCVFKPEERHLSSSLDGTVGNGDYQLYFNVSQNERARARRIR